MANKNLTNAKREKNDEFYTQFSDIQKEIEAYLEYNPNTFKDKVVYCNCDDPYESNFFGYFVLNFNKLKLKQLITTSYKPSPIANTQLQLFGDSATLPKPNNHSKITANKFNISKFIINEVHNINDSDEFNLKSVAEQLKENTNNEWAPLDGNGDFRSDESVDLLEQSDIVVTNPPFSLFREYIKQLVDYNKKFLIIGNINAITYKEVFPLIKANKIWLGPSITSGDREFEIPKSVVDLNKFTGEVRNGKYYQKVPGVRWFTNLDHRHRHQPLPLMTKNEIIKFTTKKPFEKYDNYKAIEVSFVKNIPGDYTSIMGVPVSFLDKYNPDQFEIVGMCENEDLYKQKTKVYTTEECKQAYLDKFKKTGTYDLNASGVVIRDGLLEKVYQRILIKHK